ncbi:MAG: hypothetical protein CL555_00400 [Algoriphagus sp.]|nr:hypothetical protein [Algoriphagus sp.]
MGKCLKNSFFVFIWYCRWNFRYILGSILLINLLSCNEKEDQLNFGIFPDQNYTPSEAWQRFDTLKQNKSLFNQGITKSQWWLGFTIVNDADSLQSLLFVSNNPHINRIQVFENGANSSSMDLGDLYPFEKRPFLDRDLIIPFTIPANSKLQVLLQMDKSGETFHIEPEILDFQTFYQKKTNDTLIIGGILGWMCIIFIFAVFFAAELKSWSGAIYAAYVLAISLWLATHWGLTFQFLWPTQTTWTGIARPFFNLMTNVLILLLVVNFFPPAVTGKKTAKWIWATAIFQALMALALLLPLGIMDGISSKSLFLQITLFVSLLTSILILLYPFLQWKAKVPLAGYYLLGIAILALFGIVLQLNQKILPMGLPHYLVDYGSAFALMGETGVITAAFARRASLFRKEKEKLSIEILEREKQAAEHLIQVQEDERKRLGRDLHDSIGGMLASLYIKTETIEENYSKQSLNELRQMIEQSIQEARSLSHNLTPHYLEENGLENVLKVQIELLEKKYPLKIHFYYQVSTDLGKSTELILYRIINELLQNMVKHSEAKKALISISEREGELEVIAEDDGKGIDPDLGLKGIGLKNIQERVAYLKGKMELESSASGTSHIIIIPLHA